MRVWFSLLLALSLYASAIDDRIIGLIGLRTFEQNRLILNTVFSQTDRYKKNGLIDMVEVARILERLGFLPKKLKAPTPQEVWFFSYNNPRLFFRLTEEAMQEVYIFNYTITHIQQDEDGVLQAFAFTSANIPDPVRIGSFLRSCGIKILDIQRQGDTWRYILDSSTASLKVPRVEKSLDIKKSTSALWLNVSQTFALSIVAKKGDHWFPKIFIYDKQLRPLGQIERSGPVRRLEISLPNGSYYIKISDKFTAKNIKNGFVILPK